MRHQKLRGKLERPSGHRRALVRNQVTSLLAHERIETTDAKAKVLRRVADRMITLGKRGTLHARRRAASMIRDREVTAKLFDELARRYAERPGGYTRVLKIRQRVGDAAPLSIVELVDAQLGGAKGAKAGKAKAEAPDAKPKGERKARAEKPRREPAPKPERKAKAAKAPKPKPTGGGKPAAGGAGRRGASRGGGRSKGGSK
jgi:large subunit ribosomal protein L17